MWKSSSPLPKLLWFSIKSLFQPHLLFLGEMLNQQSREQRFVSPHKGPGAGQAPLAHLAWLICPAAKCVVWVTLQTVCCQELHSSLGSGRQSRRRLAACLSCSEVLGYSVPLVSPLCLPGRSHPFMPCCPRDTWERLRHRPCVCQTPSHLNLHLLSQINLRKSLISCVPSTFHAHLHRVFSEDVYTAQRPFQTYGSHA